LLKAEVVNNSEKHLLRNALFDLIGLRRIPIPIYPWLMLMVLYKLEIFGEIVDETEDFDDLLKHI
jgi:hypothetical protein